VWHTLVERRAERLRAVFDRRTAGFPAALVVAVLALPAGVLGWFVGVVAFKDCDPAPFSLFRLELTFSARTFAAMLRSAGPCQRHVVLSFLWPDLLFPVFYAAFLSALYLWVERYRRFLPDEWTPGVPPGRGKQSAERPIAAPGLPPLASLVVVVPFLAALLDMVAENLPLYAAGTRLLAGVPASDPLVRHLVWWGSAGAALKWTALAGYAIGLVLVLLRGPRGALLWRLRFSVLSVVLGGVALLVVPQGQDILQRLVEAPHPYREAVVSVVVLTCTALVIWYFGRVLSLVRLTGEEPRELNGWPAFFERNLPRMLGVALLVFAGAAFARAGARLPTYCAVGLGAWLVAVLLAWLQQKGWRKGTRLTLAASARADLGRGLLVVLLGALIVWPSSWSPLVLGYDAGQRESLALRVAAWLALAAAVLVYVFVYYRRRAIARLRPALGQRMLQEEATGYQPGRLPPAARRLTALLGLLSGALFVAFTFATVPVARALGPLVVLSLTVANAVLVGSLLAWHGRRLRLPLVVMALALAAVFSIWNDNHRIHKVERDPAAGPVSLGPPLRERFERWLAARSREGPDSVPIILVAAAGGGLRAAYWSAASLARLQDRDSSFARHVFAISGVSGGSLGATTFAAMARDNRCQGTDSAGGRLSACVRRFMGDDFLSPVLAKMVAPDFLQWFLPVPVYLFDRSLGLERSWEDSYRRTVGDTTLAAGYLAFHAAAGDAAPMLLLNTTHVQTGRRYVTAPFPDDTIFLDSRNLIRVLNADMPLASAVHNSARFAYVSPAGRIDRRDGVSYGSLVDGGYFENSGLASLRDLQAALRRMLDTIAAGRGTLPAGAGRARFLVLYLCNDPLACRRDFTADSSLAAQRTVAGEWLSPVDALLNARDARGSLARAVMARAPGVTFLQLNVCDSLSYGRPKDTAQVRVARERVVHPPLGWELSRLARTWMDSSLTRGPPPPPAGRVDPARVLGSSCRWRNAEILDSVVELLGGTGG
jgi:hypothetical protein